MVEDAAISVFGSSSKLVVAGIDAPYLATQAFNESRWPIHVKLHGDFHSRRLKNTATELCTQDRELRACLLTACRSQGLAIVGYSGRDASVMGTLEEAVSEGRGYPSGLFWFHRPESPCLQRVQDLLEKAVGLGIDAHLIEVETFDELMSDVISLMPGVPPEIGSLLEERPRRISNAPLPIATGAWPVLRLNAFPVLSAPSVCRRIVCDIRGHKEVRQAINDSGAHVVAGRRNVGVIAFGDDSEIRKAFEPFRISELSIHSIEHRRLRYDSAELGLLYDALREAIGRNTPTIVHRRGRRAIVAVDPASASTQPYAKLRSAVSGLSGKVPETQVEWAEATRIRLELRLERLWLIIEPTIWIEETDDRSQRDICKAFVRERLARRYNIEWNKMLDGWAELLIGDSATGEMSAFGTSNGMDATFTIAKTTAFSWRGGIR